MVRLSTSRPKRSVPNGCALDGALSASAIFISVGSYGVTTLAKIASTTMVTTMPAPNRTSRLRSVSAIADPRVEVRVHEVDDEVRNEEEPADDEDGALHERIVTLKDGPQEQSPDAGQREDLLRHDRAAEQVADLDARHRDERDETVLERMAPQDTPFGQPLRARRADVVLSHHLEQ